MSVKFRCEVVPGWTWVVCLGGVILAVLFGFVVVAGNGYSLQPVYTTEPNSTEAKQQWFEKKPFSWYSSLGTQCQSSVLTVGGSYPVSYTHLTLPTKRIV